MFILCFLKHSSLETVVIPIIFILLGVIALGYVGIPQPLATHFARAGVSTFGNFMGPANTLNTISFVSCDYETILLEIY